ncbi:hypothetical protein SeMB42_g05082 [Synchytrium endobioticum]|uniref:Protein kinase domain-containing protein n=1 Tax=Synchytrium endobioticum TaxID=286115 RepID=A0A507CWD9_9FUNG|nr:hypothetical protein SeMB42_g05082 [Synchytrium endobioticum]TPX43502.1 hypothetical protein SeLEV6574_g05028 [Synchytrium endobioticum]TPX43509.1 hypothetical protein SeLEV6574_g05025 [Synchytrium endobioticum]
MKSPRYMPLDTDVVIYGALGRGRSGFVGRAVLEVGETDIVAVKIFSNRGNHEAYRREVENYRFMKNHYGTVIPQLIGYAPAMEHDSGGYTSNMIVMQIGHSVAEISSDDLDGMRNSLLVMADMGVIQQDIRADKFVWKEKDGAKLRSRVM